MLLGLGAWLAAESWIALLPLADGRRLRAPVAQYAAAVLERRLRRVRARGRGFSRLAAADLHRLRIAAKRLRYTAMFFAPLFPGRRTRAMLRSLAALQDALGGINDCTTGERLIGEARASARSALGRQALELLANWNDSARADHRRALRASWKAFRASGRFWTPPRRPRREESDRPRPGAAS
jgi:CHAD domain-containing protein